MVLADQQWELVKAWSLNALSQMGAILEHLLSVIQTLETLSQEAGRDLRSVPLPRVVEQIFLPNFERMTGSRPVGLQPPPDVVYRPIDGVRRPKNLDAAARFDELTSQPIPVVNGGVQV
jgi:hypothetical protein